MKAKAKAAPYTELSKLPGKHILKTQGARIEAARTVHGLTQRAVARAVGVSAASVSDWESDQIDNLKSENLFALADLFCVIPRWIALGDCAPTAAGGSTTITQEQINNIVATMSEEARGQVLTLARVIKAGNTKA